MAEPYVRKLDSFLSPVYGFIRKWLARRPPATHMG